MLSEIYREDCILQTHIFKWHKRFCGEKKTMIACFTTSLPNENVEKVDKIID